MRVDVVATVQVSAPPTEAFEAMVDLRSQDRWIIATRLFALHSEIAVPAVGSRMAAFTGIAGFGVLDTMEVTVYDPPRRWETRHDGGLIKGTGIFGVEPAEAGSKLTWVEELDLPLGIVGRAGWVLVKPVVRWGLARSLRKLARGIADGSLPPTTSATR